MGCSNVARCTTSHNREKAVGLDGQLLTTEPNGFATAEISNQAQTWSSSNRFVVFIGSTWIPGPMVVEMTAFLM